MASLLFLHNTPLLLRKLCKEHGNFSVSSQGTVEKSISLQPEIVFPLKLLAHAVLKALDGARQT